MLPSSSFPGTPSPRKKFANIPRIIPVIVSILLVAVFVAVLASRG